ncbi:hypothetical protein Goarm_004724 [Gossypium armourianum]|uniref:Uncharacterized protein n=1 Tax=Gossypium armourianum TaxID=34283 RepID=A0A7J9JXN8_9ROSI|nr:hypothetical protein [Gossypium armourianum]
MELIGHVSLGVSCGVFGRIITCLFSKAFRVLLMRSLKYHTIGQSNIPLVQGFHLIKHNVISITGLYLIAR